MQPKTERRSAYSRPAVAPPPPSGPSLLALGALVLSVAALMVAAVGFLRPSPTATSCQSGAWDAIPAAADLPTGWSVGSTDFYRDSQTTTLAGPDPGDGSGGPSLFVSVTCFGADAANAVTRSRSSATAVGRPVTDLAGIGEAGYQVLDSSAGSSILHFQRATLVAYVASQGTVADADLKTVGSAIDKAMQHALAGGGAPSAAPAAVTSAPSPGGSGAASSSPAASGAVGPSASPVAPALEALLPTKVGTTTLTIQSATGDMIIGTDPGSRALSAALTSLGKKPTDLQVAQAYDAGGTVDLSIMGFRVPGITAAKLKPMILETWLLANATGVKSSEVTVGGKKVTRVDYGSTGTTSYVVTTKDAVIVVDTADVKLAEQALAALP